MNTIKAGIKIIGQWQPRIQRIYDTFIMEHIPEGCQAKEATQINRCRMYLRALTVLDITTPDGKELDRGVLRGIRNISFVSVYNWSRQKKIYKQGWKEWKGFLLSCLCETGTYMLKILNRQGRYTKLILEGVVNYCLRTLEYRKEYDREHDKDFTRAPGYLNFYVHYG